MSFKQLLVASVFATSASSTLAAKPLPCPTTGPVQDTVGIIQSDTRQRIENRLRTIDTEKKHQVVLITVNNLEDYGYNTMSELAGAIGNGCKVGYRGVNNGVVVLYTQSPSKYRIEPAQSEQYITDVQSSRIIAKSKSAGVCSKDDVSCRLDSITGEIDTLIRKEFPDVQSVKEIEKTITNSDNAKTSQDLSEIANALGLGLIVLVIVGGGTFGISKFINSRKQKKELQKLKKQILELSVLLQTEKIKYPTWFQKNHILPIEGLLSTILGYSDDTLVAEYIESAGIQNGKMKTSKRNFEQNMQRIKDAIDGFAESHETIVRSISVLKDQVASNIEAINLIISELDTLKFKYDKISLPNTDEGANPDITISKFSRAISEMEVYLQTLTSIQPYHNRMKTFGKNGMTQFSKIKSKYTQSHQGYVAIFGNSEYGDISTYETSLNTIQNNIDIAYTEKNIPKLESLEKQFVVALSKIESDIKKMNANIEWYNAIPGQISEREKLIGGIRPGTEYINTARQYVSKTGNRKFSNFDMAARVLAVRSTLQQIKKSHLDKKNLNAIPELLENTDKEISTLKEYIGLGVLLAALIAEEIRQEELRIARKKREEEEAAAEQDRKSRSYSSSNDSTPSWTSGGGGGFGGAGAEDD